MEKLYTNHNNTLNQTQIPDVIILKPNVKLIIDFFDIILNKHDFASIPNFIYPQYIEHGSLNRLEIGIQSVQKHLISLWNNFPEIFFKPYLIIDNGEYVTVIWTSYKNKKEESVMNRGIDVYRIKNNKIIEHYDSHV